MSTKKNQAITIKFDRGRWTAIWIRSGKTILKFRTKEYKDLIAFLAINEPEAA